MLATINYRESQGSPKAFYDLLKVRKSINRLFLSTYLSEMPVPAGFIVPLAK
jgi:hypothetical protein